MQSRYKINYLPKARYDLLDIQDYIANKFQDPETATNQVLRITKLIKSLDIFPKTHRVRGKDKNGNEIRLCPVDNYIILYSIDDVKNVVNISRVVYSRRNIEI